MSLNIYSNTFQQERQNLETLLKSLSDEDKEKFFDTEDQSLADKYFKQRGLDKEEFYNSMIEYDSAVKSGVTDFRGAQFQFDDDPRLNTLEEIAGSLVRFGGRTIEELSDFLKLLPGVSGKDLSLARELPKQFQEYLDPYHGEGIQGDVESVGAQIASFLVPGLGLPGLALKGAGKLSKVSNLGPATNSVNRIFGTKTGKASAVGVGAAAHESIINNQDSSAFEEMIQSKEGLEILENLEKDPSDPYYTRLAKNFATNLAIEGAFLGTGYGIVKAYQAFKKTKTGKKVTRLGRKYLTVNRGTDDNTFAELLERNRSAQAAVTEADGLANDLQRSIKKNDKDLYNRYQKLITTEEYSNFISDYRNKKVDEVIGYTPENNEDIVSAALQGNKQALALLSPETKNIVSSMRKNVDDMSNYLFTNVFQGDLAVAIERGVGVYLTRTYRIYDDGVFQKDLEKQVDKFIKGDRYKVLSQDKNLATKFSNEKEKIIFDLFEFFKRRFDKTDAEIGEDIRKLVTSDESEAEDFIEGLLGASSKSNNLLGSTKVTRQRQAIPKEIKALWGEVRDPGKKYVMAMGKISELRAEHDFIKNLSTRLLNSGVARYYDDPAAAKADGFLNLEDIAKARAELVFGKGALGRTEDEALKIFNEQKKLQFGQNLTRSQIFDERINNINKAVEEGRLDPAKALEQRNIIDAERKEALDKLSQAKIQSYFPDKEKEVLEGLAPESRSVYIDPEYGEALKEMTDPNNLNGILKFWGASKGVSQAMKTVYNPATHGRNIVGNMILLMANGFNPFTPKFFQKEGKATLARIFDNMNNKETGEYLGKMIKYGIADSSITLGLVKDGLKSFGDDNKILKSIGSNKVGRLYEAEDFLFKVFHYEKTLKQMKKAYPNLDEIEVEKLAAQRTRDLMPNYDAVPKGFKLARYLPVGDFIAFPAEIARVSKNLVKYTLDDLFSDNPVLKRAATIRLAGMTSAAILPEYAENKSAEIMGISPEQQKAIDNIDIPFYTGSSKIYLSGINKNTRGGKDVDLIRLGPGDPFDALRIAATFAHEGLLTATPDSLRKSLDLGEDRSAGLSLKTALAALDRTVSPFVGTSMLTDVILSLNDDPTSIRQYPNSYTGDMFKHIGNAFGGGDLATGFTTTLGKVTSLFEPGFLKFIRNRQEYEKAIEAERIRTGNTEGVVQPYNKYLSPLNIYDPTKTVLNTTLARDIIPEFLGFGPKKFDITGSFYRNIGTRLESINNQDQEFFRKFTDINQTPDEILNIVEKDYDKLQEERKKTKSEIRALSEFYTDLGFNEIDVRKGMTQLDTKPKPKEFNKTKAYADLTNIINNIYIPTRFPSEKVLNKRFRNLFGNSYEISKIIADILRAQDDKYIKNNKIEKLDRPKARSLIFKEGKR